MADPTLISGLAGAGAIVVAAALQVISTRRNREPNGNGVSLTKYMDLDLQRGRRRIRELEAENLIQHDMILQLKHELEYAHQRIREIGEHDV